MDFEKLTSPISVEIASDFISKHKEDYRETLTGVREIVEWTIKGTRIVKVYGRDEKQGGEFTKDVRKIALKFNDKFDVSKVGSLWEVQDIVGFTIVVAYPSDIARICSLIDEAVKKKILISGLSNPSKKDDRKKASFAIDPTYGKVMADNGYFGVHYNLKRRNRKKSPICEVQIKTAVHDAWGAKTHDLTYKAPAPLDPKLIESFELLGEMLARLDHQSDVLREALENTVRVRSHKQDAINDHILSEMLNAAVRVLENNGDSYTGIGAAISGVTTFTPEAELSPLEGQIMDCEDEACTEYSFDSFAPYIAHYVLGRNANSPSIIRSAEEELAMWTERMKDPFDRVFGMANIGLFKYLNGDWFQAVEETKRALDLLGTLSAPSDPNERERFYRRCNSICISLAYYYAERIGTDEGKKSLAAEQAKEFLAKSLEFRNNLPTCPPDVFVSEDAIQACVNDVHQGESNFNCLDCELFVRIQLSETADEVENLRKILIHLHKNPPSTVSAAGLYFAFHDYCTRQRLQELE